MDVSPVMRTTVSPVSKDTASQTSHIVGKKLISVRKSAMSPAESAREMSALVVCMASRLSVASALSILPGSALKTAIIALKEPGSWEMDHVRPAVQQAVSPATTMCALHARLALIWTRTTFACPALNSARPAMMNSPARGAHPDTLSN